MRFMTTAMIGFTELAGMRRLDLSRGWHPLCGWRGGEGGVFCRRWDAGRLDPVQADPADGARRDALARHDADRCDFQDLAISLWFGLSATPS